MISLVDTQKILDHFHIGKIKDLNYWVFYYEAKTTKGTFYILQAESLTARETENKRSQKLREQVGRVERLLLPDYKGELQEYSSYVHQHDKYYSVYKKAKTSRLSKH